MAVKRQTTVRASRAKRVQSSAQKHLVKNKRVQLKKPKEKGRWLNRLKNVFRAFTLSVFYLSLVTCMTGMLFLGYRYFMASQYFSLKYIEIQGNVRLDSREILENIQTESNGNVLNLSIKDIEQKLVRLAWVEEVSIKRILPDRLVVGVKERVPAFMRLLENEMHYADGQGRIIAPVRVENFAELPVLEVEKGAEAFVGEVLDYMHSLQVTGLALAKNDVEFIRLSAAREVDFYFSRSNLVVKVGLEGWRYNFAMLTTVVADLVSRQEMAAIHKITVYGENVWVESARRKPG